MSHRYMTLLIECTVPRPITQGGDEMTREPTRPAEPYRGRWAALALLLTAVFMDMVDNQIVNIALPTIQRDLDAQPSALQWTATGYTLAFALTLITGGRLGDRFGHR